MIYGEIASDESYYDLFPDLLKLIQQHYPNVQSGVQGDAWIWIHSETEKVAIDTFSSMRFQIKSDTVNSKLVHQVIATLAEGYTLNLYDKPELEGHEDG